VALDPVGISVIDRDGRGPDVGAEIADRLPVAGRDAVEPYAELVEMRHDPGVRVRLVQQGPSFELRARRHACQRQDRRDDVDVLNGGFHPFAAAGAAGQSDGERDVEHLVVQRLAVAEPVVVEKLLAVIAR